MLDSILIAYLLLYLIFHFHHDKKWLLAHQGTMSVFAILFLIFTILNIGRQWYAGYLYESLAFCQRALGDIYLWILVGQAIVFITPVLNLNTKNRKKGWLQLLINGLIIGYLVIRYMLSDFSTSIIPGWHTTIYPSLSIYSIAIAIGVFILFDMVLVRAKFNKRN